MNRVQKVNETLTVNKRKYNISWNPNHQLNLLVELVPDMISKANVTKRLRVQYQLSLNEIFCASMRIRVRVYQ